MRRATPRPTNIQRLLLDLQSEEETVRARAVRSLCPCRLGWQFFEENLAILAALKKDPSPTVRAHALHVFQDAARMQSTGLPTHRNEVANEMLRKRRASRFRAEDGEPEVEEKGKRRRRA